MEQELEDRQDVQTRGRVAQQQQQMAARVSSKAHKETIRNPDYQGKIEDPGFDDSDFSDVPQRYPALFNPARTRGYMPEWWPQFAELKNKNEAERRKIEREPGPLVQDDPYLMAVEQGVGTDPDDPTRPDQSALRDAMDSRQRRVMDTSVMVSTALDSLSRDSRGIDATSTVKTESRVASVDDKEEESTSERMSGLIFG